MKSNNLDTRRLLVAGTCIQCGHTNASHQVIKDRRARFVRYGSCARCEIEDGSCAKRGHEEVMDVTDGEYDT